MQHSLFGALLDAEGPASSLLARQDMLDGPWTSGGPTTRDGLSIARILNDRPDVFRAFYDGFYGGGYDRDPAAWAGRVGGVTVEAYANYWYEQHGRWEGYSQGGGAAGAPLEPGDLVLPPGISETGRTVAEGHLISHILAERPDVYRAFFTEFFGPNNDRNSEAWINRVGGATVEDYANYWWETYGRASGWTPSSATASAPPEAEAEEDEALVDGAAPLVIEYTNDGVILRPAEPDDIVEDGVVIGRRTPEGEAVVDPGADQSAPLPFDPWEGLARPLVIEFRADGGVDLRPARAGEVVEDGVVVGHSLFAGDPFA